MESHLGADWPRLQNCHARGARCAVFEARRPDFFLTYGDGVADIDMSALWQSHLAADKLLTVSAVHPPARFGEMTLDADDHVVRFSEKPLYSDSYINMCWSPCLAILPAVKS
ncbi:MAG: hypothetical protein IJJ33_05690 [Victivallales bacterium]|nr:hypothetical protein [Victivallales bacterium]